MERVEKIIETIKNTYGDNAQYILRDSDIVRGLNIARRSVKEKSYKEWMQELILREAKLFDVRQLTPATAEVGDGATICLYTDKHAGTIIKKTPCTITVQQDIATLSKDFKPEIEVGGFAGHCVNQDDQTYTYERDKNGCTYVFRWSKKENRYKWNGCGICKGRHEFYDYNF